MSNKVVTVEMYFPVTNDFVKKCSRACCNWGQKKPPYDSDNKIKGII